MVKYVIRKKEFDYKGKLVKIEARCYRKRHFRDIKVIWIEMCGNISRDTHISTEKYKLYQCLTNKLEEEKAKQQIQEIELTREEKRLQCKCKQKCKSEFECGLF